LALLAGWLFHRRMIAVHQIYTFGGPMIGNADAVRAIDKEFQGRIFRFVNGPDPVPLLPMMSLIANRYSHCEKEIAASEQGDERSLGALGQAANQAVDGILHATLIDELWKGITDRVAAHGMDSYRRVIEKMLGS
jgi:hypothetical protein